ncbi:UDP:flavonoid glycosyltransferase YjiC (YdhE family) [Crossiella equi]|uniref:UDP:flavonoid glycosyltransferase YjiC (YdhE family) n=1 Tax=Crossiella equi TaxID=130796 RepID=A0ABS5AE26_9PSEU|nr:nucleotide disphospho-sugar-binding domain-containing protein [Crossiella equi]MBP2474497.1 UDP:flavonoid glycosyltransferase YjiC (YdhE family) [Crossiella equi]
MRILCTSSPGLGHLFPMVSTLWALRAAGHEVVVATSSGGARAAAAAGLPVLEAAPGADWAAEIDRAAAATPHTPQPGRHPGNVHLGASMFATGADLMVERTLAFARSFRPDLVVHEQCDATGPAVAAALGVPLVVHGLGFHPALDFYELIVAARARQLPVAAPALTVDLAPPSLNGGLVGVPVRAVPYQGGAVLPDWLLTPPEHPRVVATLGTVFADFLGLAPWRAILAAAAELDVELVLAGAPEGLGELPANVRSVGYLPLSALLATSSAVVHHAGSGSTLAALAAGVPQLLWPQGADQFFNTDQLVARGAALTAEDGGVTAEHLHRVLRDERLAAVAAEVRVELHAMPSPAELVPQLAKLV